jgi:hypothetical protein
MEIDEIISYDLGFDWEKLVHIEPVLNSYQFFRTITFKTLVHWQQYAF